MLGICPLSPCRKPPEIPSVTPDPVPRARMINSRPAPLCALFGMQPEKCKVTFLHIWDFDEILVYKEASCTIGIE